MKRLSGWLLLGSLAVAGCGGLQETWSGPGAESFRPKSIAILPPIVGAYEGAREPAFEVMAKALKESGRFERVVGPEQVNSIVQSSKEVNDAVAGFLSKLETVGLSDQAVAVKLGQALQADALLVVNVNSWEYTRSEGDKLAKVALGLRLIDAGKGAIVWKGRHEKAESYWMFKPSLKDQAADLAEYMTKYMPR